MLRMVTCIPIAGTGQFDAKNWSSSESNFARWMRMYGVHLLKPFPWDGKLDGVVGEDTVWPAASEHLTEHLLTMAESKRILLCHSYAGVIPIYAMQRRKVKIHKIVTFGTPVRKQHQALLAAAFANGCIQPNHFWHIYAAGGFWNDWTQWMGQWFDGDWTLRRWWSTPGVQNIGVKGIEHSRVLNEYSYFKKGIIETGVLDFLLGDREKPTLHKRLGF